MKILLVGCNGQLGRALAATAPTSFQIIGHDIGTLNITDRASVAAIVAEARPELILNAAAYTAVDNAEGDEAAAYAVNALAVEYLAAAAGDNGARFVHISTDFVFDGASGVPYGPDSATNPLNVYGRSKLAGEMAAGNDALIVRTAWLYAPTGDNFVRTMLRLMKERSEVRVVTDQIGSPTYAMDLAAAVWALAAKGATGIYHCTDAGVASWYDFAVAIQEEVLSLGLLDRTVPIIPVATVAFPTRALRPAYSVLDKGKTWDELGRCSSHWRVNLRTMLGEIKDHG